MKKFRRIKKVEKKEQILLLPKSLDNSHLMVPSTVGTAKLLQRNSFDACLT